jgi:hypothetical protein
VEQERAREDVPPDRVVESGAERSVAVEREKWHPIKLVEQ